MSGGVYAYFQLVVKHVIPSHLRHRPPTSTKYLLDLDFVKIRLFDKVVPKTCQNFQDLCTHKHGFGYTGSSIDHVVRGFGLYGGDIVERVKAPQPHDDPLTGLVWSGQVNSFKKPQYLPSRTPDLGHVGRSIFGHPAEERVYEDETYFEDESFEIPHDRAGVLTMANHGPNTNTSRFVILTAPAAWMDGKHVVFGEVVEGLDTVQEIERVCGSQCGHPRHLVEIVQSGVLEEELGCYPSSIAVKDLNYVEPVNPLAYREEPVYLE